MEDSQIIELYWQRSENAIAETSKKYGKLCRHIAMNIIGNFSDAEECENDTYVAVWNAIPPTRPQIFSAFINWPTSCTASEARDFSTAFIYCGRTAA